MLRVVYTTLPAKAIFNANDPGHLYNVSKHYGAEWLNSEYDGLREVLRDTFVTEFDRMTGHYTNLRDSIKKHGIIDPIVVTAGPPLRRLAWQVPPAKYVCEQLGGSRLMIAAELGLEVPCVVNDQIGIDGAELKSEADVRRLYSSPMMVRFGPPVEVSPVSYSHMDKSYTFEEQQRCRRAVKTMQLQAWNSWKEKNTSEPGR